MIGHEADEKKVDESLAETSMPSTTERKPLMGGGGGPRKPRFAPPAVKVKGIKKMKESDRNEVVERLHKAGDRQKANKEARARPSHTWCTPAGSPTLPWLARRTK